MRLLITGGAGFIGTNFVKFLVDKYPDYKITVLDKLTYAGNIDNIKDLIEDDKIDFVEDDICDREMICSLMKDCDIVLNFAAESHVDRSIVSADDFIHTNIKGTYILLDEARKCSSIKKFVQISTDEVYGSSYDGYSFTEKDILSPSSPYSSSKASAEMLAFSYFKTYNLPIVITRSSNNYGPYQHSEKFIPTVILNALQDRKIPIYATGDNVRDWVFVLDNCNAIHTVMLKGKNGYAYNIGGGNERRNIDVCKLILKQLGKSQDLIEYVKDRPGHDFRYSINSMKIKVELGWFPTVDFDHEGIKKTIEWYSIGK